MKRNLERPGLGFQTRSESAPQAVPPAQTASSLFGLISQVNKGVLAPEKKTEESPSAIDAAKNAAKAIAEKLGVENDIRKSIHIQEKRNQFIAAKANVERLFHGGGLTPAQNQQTRTVDQSTSNVFKVPDTVGSSKGSSMPVLERPGLGFEEEKDKKYLPRPVGLGRNVFSKGEKSPDEAKYSLVPYGYEDKGENDSMERQSGSRSRKERRFTEDGRRSRDKERQYSEKKESTNREDKDDSLGTLQDDYFKYGFGKEESRMNVLSLTDGRHSSRNRNLSRSPAEVGGYRDYFEENSEGRHHHGERLSSRQEYTRDNNFRNKNDVPRFMNEANVENKDPAFYNERDGERNRFISDYSNQNIDGPQPLSTNNVNFGEPFVEPSGRPVFFSAIPLNVPLGFGVPLGPVNYVDNRDDYNDKREGLHSIHYPPDEYQPRDDFRSYDDSFYDEQYREDSYGRSSFKDDRYSNDRFQSRFSDRQGDYGDFGFEPRWSDRRSQSIDSYDSPGVWDDSVGRTSERSRHRRSSLNRDSAGHNSDFGNTVETRRQLDDPENYYGFSNRSSSRERSRSPGRLRDRRHSSGGRGDFREKSKTYEKEHSSIAPEDPFVVGHRAFLEEKERSWAQMKSVYNLSERNKNTQRMFDGGYLCKDCVVTCMDSEEYGLHLHSENHLRMVQLKAQELLLKEMTAEKVGAHTEQGKQNESLRHQIPGWGRSRDRIRSRARSRSIGRRSLDRDRAGRSLDRKRAQRSLSRDRGRKRQSSERSKSGAGNENKGSRKRRVEETLPQPKGSAESLPEKPKGRLKVDNIQATSLQLFWDSWRPSEEANYAIDYCVVTDTMGDWLELGTTSETHFVVRELQEETAYKFRVTTVKGDLKSLPVVSDKVLTKKKISEKTATKEADDGKKKEEVGKKKEEGRKEEEKEEPVNEKVEEAKKKVEEMKKKADEEKEEEEEKKKKIEQEKKKKIKQEKKEEEPPKNAKIKFYEKLKENENALLLGLEYLTEIQDHNPIVDPKYKCKLCMASLSTKTLMTHLQGLPHLMKYFEKEHSEIFEKLMLIMDKKEKQTMAKKHGRVILFEKGWGAAKLIRMENPADHDGKVIFSDPISVPPPEFKCPEKKLSAEEVSKEVSDIIADQETPKYTKDGEAILQFDKLLQAEEIKHIKNGEKVEPVLGLQYIVELLHPMMNETPRYQCNLCKSNCAQKNILHHIWGRNHRLNYLSKKHTDVYEEVMKIKDKKEMNEAIDMHSVEIEETVGRERVKVLKSKNTRLWDWAKHVAEKAEKTKAEKASAVDSELVKFDVKAKEQQPTNIQPTNVLDQSPSKKKDKDWSTLNASVQERMKNQSIIKSSRPPKFNTVYSAFFKKFPVIGLQWVTEFQKPDKNEEPWYLCYLCQCKIEWKSILDHVTSVQHRMNYMQKSYSNMYSLLMRTTKNNKAFMKTKVEEYSSKILKVEHEHKMEVMLDLNFTRSLAVAAKENAGEKSFSVTTSTATVTPTKPKTTKTTAQDTAFSSGFSSLVENFKTSEEESLYKAQMEAQAVLSCEILNDKKSTEEISLYKAQLDAQAKLTEEHLAESALLQAQLQAQAELAGQNPQPAQFSSVPGIPGIGTSRGFSAEQIKPGMPVPQFPSVAISTESQPQNVAMNTASQSLSVPQNTGFANAPSLNPLLNQPVFSSGVSLLAQSQVNQPVFSGQSHLTGQPQINQVFSNPSPLVQASQGLFTQPSVGQFGQPLNMTSVSQRLSAMDQPLVHVASVSQPMVSPFSQPQLATISQPSIDPVGMHMSRQHFGLPQPNTGMGMGQVEVGINQPSSMPTGASFGPQVSARVQPSLQQGGPQASVPTIAVHTLGTLASENKNQQEHSGDSVGNKSSFSANDSESGAGGNRLDFNKRIGLGWNYDRIYEQNQEDYPQSQERQAGDKEGNIFKGEKRKDLRRRSPGYQKRHRRSLSPDGHQRPQSPICFSDRRDNSDKWDYERSRLNRKNRDLVAERDTRFGQPGKSTDYDEFDRVPEDRERIVKLLDRRDNRSQRERNISDRGFDSHLNRVPMNDFEDRYHRQAEYDLAELVSRNNAKQRYAGDEKYGYTDLESMENQMLQADLELGAASPERVRSSWERDRNIQSDSAEGFGASFRRAHGRRSRSPQQSRQFRGNQGYDGQSESRENFNSSREQNIAWSPQQRQHYNDRRPDRQHQGRSQDRYSDHGRDRDMDEDEETGRRSPSQEEIQALLAEVSSRMQVLPDEDRKMLEEELRRNLPQVSLGQRERFSHQDDRPGRSGEERGGMGPRSQSFRGGRPSRGLGFQNRGR